MSAVFLSYRREDSAAYAGRLYDRLIARFGREGVFMDVDDIRPGEDFTRVIQSRVARSRVLLALIGDEWLSAAAPDGRRRIDDPEDFVRREIAAALEAGLRVIPVLVAGAKMPAEKDLPEELRQLSRCQALEVSDTRFDLDAARLIEALDEDAGAAGRKRARRRLGLWAGAAIALAALAAILYANLPGADRAAGVEGRWRARVSYDWGAIHDEAFQFKLHAGTLTGTAGFLGSPRGILEGRLEEGRIAFSTRSVSQVYGSQPESRDEIHRYLGEVDGDEIRFVMQTEGGFSGHPPVEFVARRESQGAGSAR